MVLKNSKPYHRDPNGIDFFGSPATDPNHVHSSAGPANGFVIPPGWGERAWRTKLRTLANGGNALARLAFVGTSLEDGAVASLYSKTATQLVAAALQAVYGDGGSGYLSCDMCAGNSSFPTVLVTAWGTAIPVVTGTWGAGAAGPAATSISCNTASASGSTVTFRVRGTTVGLAFYSFSTSGGGTFTWTIDGVSQGTVNTTVTSVGSKYVSAAVGAGNHTIVVTTTGSSGLVWISGAFGYNAKGVVVDNFGHYGGVSNLISNNINANTNDLSGIYSGGWASPPVVAGDAFDGPADCVVYAMDVNDAAVGNSPANWALNVDTYFQGVLDTLVASTLLGSSGSAQGLTDIIFLGGHIGKDDQAIASSTVGPLWNQYSAQRHGTARALGAAVIDLWTIGHASWQWMVNQGYMGNGATPGVAGTDVIHLSDAGHAWRAAQLLTVLGSS